MMDLTISTREAAALLGKSESFLKASLQQGTRPFGFAAKTKEDRYSYCISRSEFMKWLGIEEEGADQE